MFLIDKEKLIERIQQINNNSDSDEQIEQILLEINRAPCRIFVLDQTPYSDKFNALLVLRAALEEYKWIISDVAYQYAKSLINIEIAKDDYGADQ